jgi:hypothetical protein
MGSVTVQGHAQGGFKPVPARPARYLKRLAIVPNGGACQSVNDSAILGDTINLGGHGALALDRPFASHGIASSALPSTPRAKCLQRLIVTSLGLRLQPISPAQPGTPPPVGVALSQIVLIGLLYRGFQRLRGKCVQQLLVHTRAAHHFDD